MMGQKKLLELTEDEWIEQYGISSLLWRESDDFVTLLNSFPNQYSSVRTIVTHRISQTDEVYNLLKHGAPPVVFEKWKLWQTIPDRIRLSLLDHHKLDSTLESSTEEAWSRIPDQLADELPEFRSPDSILRVAAELENFAERYFALPGDVQRALRSIGFPGSVIEKLKPEVYDSVPEPLRQTFLEYTPSCPTPAGSDFHWDALTPAEQSVLKENTNIGGFLEHFNATVWQELPPRVRELAAANMSFWKPFFSQPQPPVWRDVPDEYLELSVIHNQTILFCSEEMANEFLHETPQQLRKAYVESGRLNLLLNTQQKIDLWEEFPSMDIARKVISSVNVYYIGELMSRERWEAIPSRYHDILASHGALHDIFTKARPEFWNLVPEWLMPRLFDRNELLQSILKADHYEDCHAMIDEFIREETEFEEQHQQLAPAVPTELFRAVMLPLLFRQKMHPSEKAERLIERQAGRLRQAFTETQSATETLPTIGYELEFERLYAPKEDYEWLRKNGAWKKGADKAYEIASNVFPSGRIAALSMFSLLHSGLVAQSELRPALFSVHVNLGIPKAFRERLPSAIKARELQQSLLPGHTSAERMRKQEWIFPTEVQPRRHVEGDAVGRVELRVHDLHDMWIYSLLQKAPEAAHLWLADYAQQEGVNYVPNQSELAAQWQGVRTEQRLNESEFTDPELLAKKKFTKPRR